MEPSGSVIVLGKTAESHAVPLSYPSRTAGLQKRSRVMESQSALALRAM